MRRIHIQRWSILLLVLLSQSLSSYSIWPFTSANNNNNNNNNNKNDNSNKYYYSENQKSLLTEFSMEAYNDDAKGLEVVERVNQQMLVQDSCWQRAYKSISTECSVALANEEIKGRLAWNLCDCFVQHSGKSPLPKCDAKSPIKECLQKLDDDHVRGYYLEFFLQIRAFCHQLQIEAWKSETHWLVNALKGSAIDTVEKLDDILKIEKELSQSSKDVQESLASIDSRTQLVAETSKNVEDRVNAVFMQSDAILEQSKGIAESQLELNKGQAKMKETLQENMAVVHESFTNLDHDINGLKTKTEGVKEEIVKVGNEMTFSMNNLHSKADDIGDTVGKSLDKQRELLNGQVEALNGLNLLTKTQSQAVEESRASLENLAQLGHEQQQELLRRQKQLQETHDQLVEKSKTILAAQETFESKQASMFLVIEKLFTVLNAMLLESRLMKAFLVYSLSIFVLYMFTSTKQTYNVRSRLYMGLCLTFLFEMAIVRYGTNEIENQTWNVSIVRSLFLLLASCQLLYSIWTFRDYDVLNHQMLRVLVEMVNGIQKHREYLSWEMENDDSDSEMDWSSWIQAELQEEVDRLKDPDFVLLEEENSVGSKSITRRYNLRNHNLLTN